MASASVETPHAQVPPGQSGGSRQLAPPAPVNPLTGRAPAALGPTWPSRAAANAADESLYGILDDHARGTPSPAIVLFSAATGLAGAVVGYFFGSELLQWRVEANVALAVLLMCGGIGLSGALLSVATRSRAAVANIGFSCGVVLLTLVFFGLCGVIGGLAATLLVAAGS